MKNRNPWFEYAKEDYSAMNALIGQGMVRPVLFHAQQIVEKCLKGLTRSIYKNALRAGIRDNREKFIRTVSR